MTDPRLERSVRPLPGGVPGSLLAWKAREAFEPPAAFDLEDAPIPELAALAGTPPGDACADASRAFFWANGWQSWSPGWELAPGERHGRVRIVGKLNLYNERHLPPRRDGRAEACFAGWLRAADGSGGILAFAATDPDLAPLTFRLDRKGDALGVEAFCAGARFAKGETVAEAAIFHAPDFFAARDRLRAVLGNGAAFAKLEFLGEKGKRLVPGGWESWYNHYSDIDERLIRADLEAIGANGNLLNEYYLRRGKPAVFQVDDGWQRTVGDWRPNDNRFPGGMESLAAGIEAKGLVPGLWMAPFAVRSNAPVLREHPDWILKDARGKPAVVGWQPAWDGDWHGLDLTVPEVLDYLEHLIDTAANEWGFRYLKLDFLFAGAHSGAWSRPAPVHTIYRRAVERLTRLERTRSGKPVAYLGCGAPLGLSYDRLPLMRIGADTLERWDDFQTRLVNHAGRPSAWVNMKDTIGRAPLDGAAFVNDPDVVFCRTENMGLTETEKETVALVSFLFASQVMFSDDPEAFDEAEEKAFTERVVALWDRLASAECAALRIPGFRDVYRVGSRDRSIDGVVNLSDRAATLPLHFDRARALVDHARPRRGGSSFEARSVTLWENPA
ncbi:MAG: alpha-galactosidase [Spirochaetales bacterium]|nr:alpha-galactosidase [Spirochaetales bacterium]